MQAAVEATVTLVNDIDQLAILDRQLKALEAQVKALKADIANSYGEGAHRGEQFGVRVGLEQRKGSVNMAALCKAFGITEADLDAHRGDNIAVIKVTPTA